MRTVLFGPFVGELGWELLWWHGWVRKRCLTDFKDHRKIVASYPGREPFYPDADEFWAHPDYITEALVSPRGYISDFWQNGVPQGNVRRATKKFRLLNRSAWDIVLPDDQSTDIKPLIDGMLDSYREALSDDTVYFVPYEKNRFEPDDLTFGTEYPGEPRSDNDFVSYRIPFDKQILEELHPTENGRKLFREISNNRKPLICVFPRYRRFRRPDKNWERRRYLELIAKLQHRFPDLIVAIVGAPRDAYFADGVPEGCLDLISIPDRARLDIQIAALQESVLALGSPSGAILLALAAGSPTITWGWPEDAHLYHDENFLRTPFIFHPAKDATVAEIETLATAMITNDIRNEPGEILLDSEKYLASRSILWRMRRLVPIRFRQ